MYRIIGADGVEYGPFSADDLRQLILQRRADSATRARLDTDADWRALADFPEFHETLQQGAASPAAVEPPLAPASISVGELLRDGWSLVTANFPLLAAATFIILLISVAISAIPLVGPFVGAVLIGPLWSGLCLMSIKLVRNQPIAFNDAFAGFGPAMLQLMAVGIIYQIGTTLGCAILILPGIYLLVVWSFSYLVVIDRQLPFWDAMELSRKTIQRNFFQFLWLWLVVWFLLILGAAFCGVGLLAAAPLANNMFALAYEKTFGLKAK